MERPDPIILIIPKEVTMKKILSTAFVVCCLVSAFIILPVSAADPGVEAKAVFAKLVKAAKAKNVEKFKSYIVKADLREMEKDGMVELMMEMIADDKPELYTAEVKGDRAILKKEITKKTKDGTSTEKSTVHMVKESGQWKMGKPQD
jgi:hypothetical protein